MKKIILSIFSVSILFSSYSQTVTSVSVIPSNATSSDNIKVVAVTSFPGGPCSFVSAFPKTQSHDTIILNNIYCYQSGSGGCTSTDTFPIGQLAAGNYVIRFKLSSTNTSGPCGSLSYVLKDIGIHSFTVTGGTTGIANAESRTLKIYPNPASDFVTIYFNEQVQSDAEIKILDVNGAIVKNLLLPKKADEVKTRIDVSGLPSGVYFYAIKTKETSVSGKLVIAD